MSRRAARRDEPQGRIAAGLAMPEVGWLVEGSTPSALLVDYPSNVRGPVAARAAIAIDGVTLERAVRTKQGIVLQFERGQADLPIVTGVIQSTSMPLMELLLARPCTPLAPTECESPPESVTESHESVTELPAESPTESHESVTESLAEHGFVAKGEARPAQDTHIEARLDGKRVVLEADQEIVLRCGQASLILTRDGKVILRGAYVETHSRGVNRIKGGTVRIN